MRICFLAIVMGCLNSPVFPSELVLNWNDAPTQEQIEKAPSWAKSFTPDGKMRLLTIESDESGLRIPAGKVRWARIAGKTALQPTTKHVQLVGDLTASPPAIEEVSDPDAPLQPMPVPPLVELKDAVDWKAFGVEERVTQESKLWNFGKGNKPAGLYSGRAWRIPSVSSKKWVIQIQLAGKGQVDVGLAEKIKGEFKEPSRFQRLKLGDQFQTAVLPANSGREFQLVIAAVADGLASVECTSILCKPSGKWSPRNPKRGVWNWSTNPEEWRSLESAWKAAHVSVLQLALSREIPASMDGELQRLQNDGFSIVAVEGDPHMILPEAESHIHKRLAQLAPITGMRAVQYDVEPYLIPGFQLDDPQWQKQWASFFKTTETSAKKPLEAVVPFWLLNSESGRKVLDGMSDSVSRVVVMNYRTDLVETMAWATLWLEWSIQKQRAVSIALECGPIPDTKATTFRAATEGQLWVSPWKDHGMAVVLFEEPVAAEGAGKSFTMGHESAVPGNRTTFKGNPDQLLTAITAFDALVSTLQLPENLTCELLLHEPASHDLEVLQRTGAK